MNAENSQKKTFFDIATVLTVSGILLYYLGWMYWQKYFLTLSIRPSLVEISFEKVIVTTWLTIIGLVLSFGFAFQHLIENKEKKDFEIFDSFYVIIISIFLALSSKAEEYFWYILTGVLLVYVTVRLIVRKRKITLARMPKKNFLILLSVIIYLFGIYFYRDKGQRDAERLMETYCEDFEIKMTSGETVYGKFITFMNSKYFLIIENPNCEKEVIVINDSEAHQVRFLN